MAKDTYWPDVILAMPMDDIGLSDFKGNPTTITGNTHRSNVNSKFGGYSARFDGNGDYILLPNTSLFDFTGPFTIECWVYLLALPAQWCGVVSRYYEASSLGWRLLINSTAHFSFVDANGVVRGVNGLNLSLNTWTHLAVTWDGSYYRVFVDGAVGTPYALGLPPKAVVTAMAPLVGATNISNWYMNGYIDDLRITKGVARYTANFTPPTEPFVIGGYEVGGTIVDANNSPVSRTIRVYDRVTGALAGSGQSSPVTGIYNVAINTANEVQVVMLDDALGTTENDQILRTTPV